MAQEPPPLQNPSSRVKTITPGPFSRLAIGVGVSAMGINMQAAVNANRYLNLRGIGNFFNYTDNNISTNGFNLSAKLNLASAGAALDYYPFPNHGLRLSPGVLFYNQNAVDGTIVAPGGTSFTLNNATYYSSQSNPVTGVASVVLNRQKPAPTATIGWGNMIPRSGGHWSLPFELGAAYIGKPELAMQFVSGQVCTNPQGTIGCQNVVGNQEVNNNLQAQLAKDNKNLAPLRFYPIVSFGVAYSFRIR